MALHNASSGIQIILIFSSSYTIIFTLDQAASRSTENTEWTADNSETTINFELSAIRYRRRGNFRMFVGFNLIWSNFEIIFHQPLTPKPIDPFYSPILSKLDNIFHQMGYVDEPCKERMVCNMYRDPLKYSPHSNYVSVELSR